MQGGHRFISLTALTFPHFAAQGSIRQHFPSSSKAVRVNETLSARVRLLLRSKAALSGGSESGGGMLWFEVSLRESAVVEHKAQTHFEGFALLSNLFCERYPAAHMYL